MYVVRRRSWMPRSQVLWLGEGRRRQMSCVAGVGACAVDPRKAAQEDLDGGDSTRDGSEYKTRWGV
jgi:hypothetical protein